MIIASASKFNIYLTRGQCPFIFGLPSFEALICSSTVNTSWIKVKVLFIKLAAVLATELGHNSKPYNKQL